MYYLLRFTASGDQPFSHCLSACKTHPVSLGANLARVIEDVHVRDWLKADAAARALFHVSDLSVIWWPLNYAPDLYLVGYITERAQGLWISIPQSTRWKDKQRSAVIEKFRFQPCILPNLLLPHCSGRWYSMVMFVFTLYCSTYMHLVCWILSLM